MDVDLYFRFLLALSLVLGLILGLAWLVRRFGPGSRLLPNSGKTRRLGIVEVVTVDARRRLILLKRDSKEYLVLLGPTQDLLLDKDQQPAPEEQLEAGKEANPADLSLVSGGGSA